jgi:hypothetical protein
VKILRWHPTNSADESWRPEVDGDHISGAAKIRHGAFVSAVHSPRAAMTYGTFGRLTRRRRSEVDGLLLRSRTVRSRLTPSKRRRANSQMNRTDLTLANRTNNDIRPVLTRLLIRQTRRQGWSTAFWVGPVPLLDRYCASSVGC